MAKSEKTKLTSGPVIKYIAKPREKKLRYPKDRDFTDLSCKRRPGLVQSHVIPSSFPGPSEKSPGNEVEVIIVIV